MKSAGNRGVVQSRLQVLHVHVFLVAPLGARHVAEPGADQHPHTLVANDELYAVHVDVWIPSTLQGAVAKDTPLNRGMWSVTLPEVVVRFRS